MPVLGACGEFSLFCFVFEGEVLNYVGEAALLRRR